MLKVLPLNLGRLFVPPKLKRGLCDSTKYMEMFLTWNTIKDNCCKVIDFAEIHLRGNDAN